MNISGDTASAMIMVVFFAFFILLFYIRKVPRGTVYIIDRNTHYHRTVKRGYFMINPRTDKITTEISLTPKIKTYQNYYETEDGKVCLIVLSVTYSAQDVEDVLYNLSATRRSIDDVIQGSMYHAVLSLKQPEINVSSLTREFERNIDSQVLGLCINVHNFNINYLDKTTYKLNNVTVFKPHKSRGASESGPFTYDS